MATATQAGQAGLMGWRGKLADGVAEPVSHRTPLSEEQVRGLIGGVFFVLAAVYVARTIAALVRQRR
ncbi:MAG TPA: hypothetical protein VD836_02725 [Solirubrobacteraceae bacterium]|nr:hypothetical protein [Solirubrobacteraceae bacterium]